MKTTKETTGIYRPGSIVYAKSDPKTPLFVRRYDYKIYYCRSLDDPQGLELALFLSDIVNNLSLNNGTHGITVQ